MKTKTQVVEEFGTYKVLIDAVIDRIAMDSIVKVIEQGIDSAYNGFTLPADTYQFAMRYRDKIVELLEEESAQLGIETMEMVAGFGVFRSLPMNTNEQNDLHAYLNGGQPMQGRITDGMAWFCAEEVCRFFDDTDYEAEEDNWL